MLISHFLSLAPSRCCLPTGFTIPSAVQNVSIISSSGTALLCHRYHSSNNSSRTCLKQQYVIVRQEFLRRLLKGTKGFSRMLPSQAFCNHVCCYAQVSPKLPLIPEEEFQTENFPSSEQFFICLFIFSVLGMEPRASHRLYKRLLQNTSSNLYFFKTSSPKISHASLKLAILLSQSSKELRLQVCSTVLT